MKRGLPRLRSENPSNAAALALAAAAMLVPANLLPVVTTESPGATAPTPFSPARSSSGGRDYG